MAFCHTIFFYSALFVDVNVSIITDEITSSTITSEIIKENSNYGYKKINSNPITIKSEDWRTTLYMQGSQSDALGRAVERYSLEGEFIDAFDSAADACRKLGWPLNRQSNISAVCRGVRKSTLGYMWKFKEES